MKKTLYYRPHHLDSPSSQNIIRRPLCLLIMSEVATVTKGGGAYRRLWKGLLYELIQDLREF